MKYVSGKMVVAAATVSVVLGGCDGLEEKRPPPSYPVVVLVESDPGTKVAGASILLGAKKVASTDADGKAEIKLRGDEGETFVLSVKCPEGHQTPNPLTVTLRRIAQSTRLPEYQVACPPSTRSIVVAVRADNGPNLPVMYLGREVARTDRSGAAHVSLKLPADEPFQLMLKTSGVEAGEGLRPQDPVADFRVKDYDDVVIFDQGFKKVVKRRVIYRRRKPTVPKPL